MYVALDIQMLKSNTSAVLTQVQVRCLPLQAQSEPRDLTDHLARPRSYSSTSASAMTAKQLLKSSTPQTKRSKSKLWAIKSITEDQPNSNFLAPLRAPEGQIAFVIRTEDDWFKCH